MKSPLAETHVLEDLLDYLEGRLSEDEAVGVAAHLAACERCSSVYEWAAQQRSEVIQAGLRHLHPDRIVALADQAAALTASEARHLSWCESCRRDLDWSRVRSESEEARILIQQNNLYFGWPGVAAPPRRRPWMMTAALAVGVVAVLMLGFLGALRLRTAWVEPAVKGNGISGEARFFGRVWSEEHKADVGPVVEAPWGDANVLVYGLRGGATDGARVFARDLRTGDLIWSILPDREEIRQAFGDEYLGDGFFGARTLDFGDFDGDGIDELVVMWGHHRWYPAIVARVSPEGALLDSYYHFGVIYDQYVGDLDGDGREDFLFAATNNGRAYQGATLVLLQDGYWQGASVDSLVGADSPIREGAVYRVVLPQYPEPYMSLLTAQRLRAEGLSVGWKDGSVRIEASVGNDEGSGSVVTFDAQLHPLSVQIGDSMEVAARDWSDGERERFMDPEFQRRWLGSALLYGRKRE